MSANTSSSSSAALSLLVELDANPWVNVLRLGIALNTIGSNAFLLALFVRSKQLRQSQCNKLILLNGVADFVTGVGPLVRGAFQLYVLGLPSVHITRILCILVCAPYNLGLPFGQVTFLALAFDRLMAILSPLRYGKSDNNHFLCTVIALGLFCSILLFSMTMVANNLSAPSTQCSIAANAGPYFNTMWTWFNLASAFIAIALYMALLSLYLKMKSASKSPEVHGNQTAQPPKSSNSSSSSSSSKEMRLTRTIALILANYSCSWIVPTAVWFTFNVTNPANTARMNYVSWTQGFITAFGCGLNLYIYLLKHAEIKRCARQMLSGQANPNSVATLAQPTQTALRTLNHFNATRTAITAARTMMTPVNQQNKKPVKDGH